ncbi:toll-like receptor 7 [Toxorhynchites rutilus septentrionalis]|uniref:toll-like receptor 7 n=1 Tax=Toxorhynchites rutilus septentrionalis TaxID=329112 RepID=UPI00247A6EAF|nr:toll-like receptor 7 [Toxorhynchites rutilus septentrionalis]
MFILLPVLFTLSRALLENNEDGIDYRDERSVHPDCHKNVTECKLEVIVNFEQAGAEYAIQFDCSKDPVIDHPSMNVFKNVQSYKLLGGEVTCNEFGLRYLNFPINVEQLELEDFCLEDVKPNVFADFSNLKKLTLKDSIIYKTSSLYFEGLDRLNQLAIINMSFPRTNTVGSNHPFDSNTEFDVTKMFELENITVVDTIITSLTSIVDTFPQRLQFIHMDNVSSQKPVQIRLDGKMKSPFITSLVLRKSKIVEFELCDYALLCYLDLSNNELTETKLYLYLLPNLKVLDLSFNLIEEINGGHFTDCPNIMKLIIRNNKIQNIKNDVLENFKHLEYLDLSFNRLHRLQSFLKPMFASIQVDNNPWDCIWLSHLIYDQPELYSRLKYVKVHNSLGVRGLPCHIGMEEISLASVVKPPMHSTIAKHPVGLIQPHPTVSVKEPYNVPSKFKIILVTIASGVFVAQILLLLYNRHRRHHFQPFYRRLPKDTASSSIRDTITTRTTSFLYEKPIREDQETEPNNIYEEIREEEQTYDLLQFHRTDLEEDILEV